MIKITLKPKKLPKFPQNLKNYRNLLETYKMTKLSLEPLICRNILETSKIPQTSILVILDVLGVFWLWGPIIYGPCLFCPWRVRRPKPRRAMAQALQYRAQNSFRIQPRIVQSSADPKSHRKKGVKLV